MRSRACLMLAALVLVTLASLPITAAAAAPAPGDIQVQLWAATPEGGAIAIISVLLDESVQLPATVRLPVPQGAKVDWAGEIDGSGAGGDVQAEFELVDGAGGPYAEFTVNKHRDAQIEVSGLESRIGPEGGTAVLEFTQSVPSSVTAFSVRLPAGAQTAKVTPAPSGEPQTNEAGESLFTLPSRELKMGQKVIVRAEWGDGQPSQPMGAGISSGQLVGVLGAAIALAVVLLVVAVRRRPQVANESSPASSSDTGSPE